MIAPGSLRRLLLSAGLTAAISLSPAWAAAQDGSLADVRRLVDRGAYAEALTALEPAAGKDAALADLLRAEIELRTGKYAEAEKSAARAAKDKAQRPAAVALRAEALAARGKLADAIAALRDVESDPEARRARLLLGEYLIQSGKRADARAPLMTLIQDYNSDVIKSTGAAGLTMVGRAAHLLRSARDANDAYGEAEKAGGKTSVETLLGRAELFLEKYNPGGAGTVVKEAEALAPNDPRVRVMKARVMLENAMDFDGADSELRRALEVNPALPSAF